MFFRLRASIDLSRADLAGIGFPGADLRTADFTEADPRAALDGKGSLTDLDVLLKTFTDGGDLLGSYEETFKVGLCEDLLLLVDRPNNHDDDRSNVIVLPPDHSIPPRPVEP